MVDIPDKGSSGCNGCSCGVHAVEGKSSLSSCYQHLVSGTDDLCFQDDSHGRTDAIPSDISGMISRTAGNASAHAICITDNDRSLTEAATAPLLIIP